MDGIEMFRERLYVALDGGNMMEVLEISRLLDCEIVNFMKSKLIEKKSKPEINPKNQAGLERSY